MPHCMASICWRSVSIFTSAKRPANSRASLSRIGERFLQGAHHDAQKSTSIGVFAERSNTSCSKFRSSTSMDGAEAVILSVAMCENYKPGAVICGRIPGKIQRRPPAPICHRSSRKFIVRMERLPLLALIALSIIWGYSWIVMKVALRHAGVFDFSLLRVALGGLCLFIVLLFSGRPVLPPRGRWREIFALGMVQTGAYIALSMWALKEGAVGRTAVLIFTMPFWTLVLARLFLHERLRRTQWLAVVLSAVGLAIIIQPWNLSGSLAGARPHGTDVPECLAVPVRRPAVARHCRPRPRPTDRLVEGIHSRIGLQWHRHHRHGLVALALYSEAPARRHRQLVHVDDPGHCPARLLHAAG